MDIQQVRLKRVRQLIAEKCEGKPTRFADITGIQAAYASRWWTDKSDHKRNVGERMARRIESAFDLPRGWLDYDPTAKMSDVLLIAGYHAASPEGQEWMEQIARRALEGKGKPDNNDHSTE